MKVFIITKDGIPITIIPTSLKEACKLGNISYTSASRGRNVWCKHGIVTRLFVAQVVKIKGRGSKNIGK